MLSPILVAGEWRRGRGDVYATRYPADDTVNAELAVAVQYKHQKSLYWGMNEMPRPWAD